ncbi:MAG: hypothetical protein KBA49_06265 [Methanolinea sp.]|jgi:hypothetical protein|nr:hypothetical protein [Methanolinea sp.]
MGNASEQIEERLLSYPHISEITGKGLIFDKLAFDPYNRDCELDLESDGELTLAGVLLHSDSNVQFRCMIEHLEKWLELYPEYKTKQFGKKLGSNFFDYYSEIETYHRLRLSNCSPQIDPLIGLKNNRLDFRISLNEREIFIEVITPRPSVHSDNQFIEGYTGFFDFERGTIRERDRKSRLEIKIEEEIRHHLMDLPDSFQTPIIIIANCTYCSLETGDPEIWFPIMQPQYLHGLLCYDFQSKECTRYNSDFHVNPRYSLSTLEKGFFKALF